MNKGYGVLIGIVIIAAVALAALVEAQIEVSAIQEHILREQGTIEAEIIARACLSTAFARYENGLRIFPKNLFLDGHICTVKNISTNTDFVIVLTEGFSLGQTASIEGVFSQSSLQLISYSFE